MLLSMDHFRRLIPFFTYCVRKEFTLRNTPELLLREESPTTTLTGTIMRVWAFEYLKIVCEPVFKHLTSKKVAPVMSTAGAQVKVLIKILLICADIPKKLPCPLLRMFRILYTQL